MWGCHFVRINKAVWLALLSVDCKRMCLTLRWLKSVVGLVKFPSCSLFKVNLIFCLILRRELSNYPFTYNWLYFQTTMSSLTSTSTEPHEDVVTASFIKCEVWTQDQYPLVGHRTMCMKFNATTTTTFTTPVSHAWGCFTLAMDVLSVARAGDPYVASRKRCCYRKPCHSVSINIFHRYIKKSKL